MIEGDPRPQIYQALHTGDKPHARSLLWQSIGREDLFSNSEWDRLYVRAGGIDEGERYMSTENDRFRPEQRERVPDLYEAVIKQRGQIRFIGLRFPASLVEQYRERIENKGMMLVPITFKTKEPSDGRTQS